MPDGPAAAAGAAGHGAAIWSSPAWRDEAVAWLDARLEDVGIHRTDEIELASVLDESYAGGA